MFSMSFDSKFSFLFFIVLCSLFLFFPRHIMESMNARSTCQKLRKTAPKEHDMSAKYKSTRYLKQRNAYLGRI